MHCTWYTYPEHFLNFRPGKWQWCIGILQIYLFTSRSQNMVLPNCQVAVFGEPICQVKLGHKIYFGGGASQIVYYYFFTFFVFIIFRSDRISSVYIISKWDVYWKNVILEECKIGRLLRRLWECVIFQAL